MTSTELAEGDYAALAAFRYQIRLFLHFSEQAARGAGLEPQQHQLLLALRAHPEGHAIVGVLAERLQLQHHSVVELIDRLAKRGFVRRSRAAQDRRQVVVQITALGRSKLEKLSQSHLEELSRAAPGLVKSLRSIIRRKNVSK